MVVIFTTIFFISLELFGNDIYKNHQGLWVVRHNLKSKKSIDFLIKNILQLKIKNIYLQIRGRGYAYYNSQIEPKSPDVAPDFDPLQYFLSKIEPYDIHTHAWINTYLLWTAPNAPAQSEHLFFKHPEWFEKTINPSKIETQKYIYLSPHLNDVNIYLIKLIDELISNYELDGIHLDYVRYNNNFFHFHNL